MLLRFTFTDADRAKVKACLPPALADTIIPDLEALVAELRHVLTESDPQALREAGAVLAKRRRAVRDARAAFRRHPLADAMLDAALAYHAPQTRMARLFLVQRLVEADGALSRMLSKSNRAKMAGGRPADEDARDLALRLARILLAHGVRAARYEPGAETKWSRGGGAFARLLRVVAPLALARPAPTDLRPWLEFVPKEWNAPEAVAQAVADAARQKKAERVAGGKDLARLRRMRAKTRHQ